MAITFIAAGTAVAGILTTMDLVAPSLAENDIIIAQLSSNDNDAVALPSTAWTIINELNNGTGLRSSVAWKRALLADSGATFQFTGLAGTTVNFGVLTVYRGVRPHGPATGTNTSSANASADAVTYATLTPLHNAGVIVACGHYQEDLTTAGALTTFTNVVDVETPTGNDLSLFQYFIQSNGTATGAISHTTTSTVDAVNNGILFDLIPASEPTGGDSPTYARLERGGRRG